jgi:hypothetical protein
MKDSSRTGSVMKVDSMIRIMPVMCIDGKIIFTFATTG